MASFWLAGPACERLPDVQYQTDRLEIAVDFDAPLCQGTLDGLDEHVTRVERMLGGGYDPTPIRVYWLSAAEITERCGDGRSGCFFPGTRVLFSNGSSLTHELVHAVLDSEGESYFVEEGMAEMLSGVGVYYDASQSDGSAAEGLRLSRHAYRSGRLDYAAAAHFVRWIYETAGAAALVRLAREIEARASASEIAAKLEAVLGEPMTTIETQYRLEAPKYFPGLAHDSLAAPSWSQLRSGLTVALDCQTEHTRGPLPSGEAGLYQVFRVVMPSAGVADVAVQGPPGSFVELVDPYARIARGWVQDWTLPNPALDPRALRVEAGAAATLSVRAHTYLLVVGIQDADAGAVTVTVTPPPTRAAGEPAPHRTDL